MSDQVQQNIEAFTVSFGKKVRSELQIRCEKYKPDFRAPEVYNVVAALLARQATLGIELVSAPQIWNNHSAPLFLRAMTDVHITLSWILLDPLNRAMQYVEHGLGQAVLMLEHRRANLEAAPESDRARMKASIESDEAWINAQKLSFLVDVNVGSWSGKTTRDMAQEAGILDFYNYVYTPFSQCAHSTWYHVGRFNSRPSQESLTALIWSPEIGECPNDFWNVYLAAKYIDKTFNEFDEKALGEQGNSTLRD